MRILAFETTGLAGSVAALDDERVELARALPAERRSAQTLAVGLREALAAVGWRPRDVELIAVAVGPGSFTGLRVGIATAKMLTYAIGCPLIGVPTLAAIASQAPADASPLWVALDAQRGELYAARYGAELATLRPTEIIGAAAFLAGLAPGDAVTGPALETLAPKLPTGTRVVDRALWAPSATAVGRMALRDYRIGRRDDPFQLAPVYLRRTAAEEQWERRTPRR